MLRVALVVIILVAAVVAATIFVVIKTLFSVLRKDRYFSNFEIYNTQICNSSLSVVKYLQTVFFALLNNTLHILLAYKIDSMRKFIND